MRITNAHGLPESILRAVDTAYRPKTDPRRYSVTELIDAPRYVQLRRRHWDELEQDASEMIWLLFGTVVHKVLEQSGPENALTEERFVTRVGEYTVSGVADLYEIVDGQGVLSDWKTTSVWGRLLDNLPRAEHVRQLNVYAYLYRQAGFPVDRLQVIALYRDWQQSQVERRSDYPKAAVEVLPVPLWTPELSEAYLLERLQLQGEATELPDDALPACTAGERWAKPTVWAVMKQGRKSAIKLFDNAEGAYDVVYGNPDYYAEERPGEDVRCERYCPVAMFCKQSGV